MFYHQVLLLYNFLIIHIFILFFLFNDTATTEIYTLSLHDALPISPRRGGEPGRVHVGVDGPTRPRRRGEEDQAEAVVHPLVDERRAQHHRPVGPEGRARERWAVQG